MRLENEQNEEKQLVLLFGATGRSGFCIAERLMENYKNPIRIVVRNKQKISELFKEKELAFQSIIQGQLHQKQTLQKAFKPSQFFGNVKIVISALGSPATLSQNIVKQVEQTSQINIINQSLKANVQKFILISAALIQRPWNPITVLLNTMVSNVYHYKVNAQNFLRTSGLKYIIIRPPQLTGQIQEQQVITAYNLEQGDKVMGKISRKTLSQVVVDSVQSQTIKQKVTFEVKQNLKQDYIIQQFSNLKQDTQKSILHKHHKLAKRVSLVLYATGLFCSLGWLTYIALQYFKSRAVEVAVGTGSSSP